MSFLPDDDHMRRMFWVSLALFLVVGFTYPSSSSSKSPSKITLEYTAQSSLKEIDFSSKNLKNYITQGYGYTRFAAVHGGLRENRHNGIDIAANYGAEIKSQNKGEVYYVGDQDKYCRGKAYGKFVIIKNKDSDHYLLYSHLSKIKVEKGDDLKEGEVLGEVGTSGLTTGPHLHFSIFKTGSLKIINDQACGPKPQGPDINPLDYLD